MNWFSFGVTIRSKSTCFFFNSSILRSSDPDSSSISFPHLHDLSSFRLAIQLSGTTPRIRPSLLLQKWLPGRVDGRLICKACMDCVERCGSCKRRRGGETTHSLSKTSRSVIRFAGSFSSMHRTRFCALGLMELHSSEGKSIVPFLELSGDRWRYKVKSKMSRVSLPW